jgi:uncharacterized membrane protein
LPNGWGEFLAALALFAAAHAVPARPAVRRCLVGRVGERAYVALYSALSVALFGWVVAAAGRAPHVALWSYAPWQAWAPNLAMPAACLLVAFGANAANPLSFGGGAGPFDPDRPGVAGVARHPLLAAIALWAAAHAVPNGDLAHLVLFGGSAAASVAGMAAIDRRRRREMGGEAWRRLAARTSFWPGAAPVSGRWRPRVGPPDAKRVAVAAALYAGLLLSHGAVMGVSPLPPR